MLLELDVSLDGVNWQAVADSGDPVGMVALAQA
jgi:hypothetical protein